MTLSVTGRATTDRAPRYLKQLASHLSEKLDVTVAADGSATVRYEEAIATLTATDRTLEYAITGDVELHVYRSMGIVAGHLEKFGAREGLRCGWDDPEIEAAFEAKKEQIAAARRAEVDAQNS